MLESGSSGSVRGVLSNEHPYREPGSKNEPLANGCFGAQTGRSPAIGMWWLRKYE
jgi:hypothetical protein